MFDINVGWTQFAIYREPLIETEDVVYVDMNVRIVPDWNVSIFMEWDPLDNPEGVLGDPLYSIYYSESELGPFLPLTAQPTSSLSFFTTWQVQDSKVFEQFFTIEATYPDGEVFRSQPYVPGNGLPKWHLLRHKDIIRRAAILLDKFVGIETIVFNPKYRGMRCTKCWDPVHLKVTNDHCETCYGMGYEGGYDTGMRTLFQYTAIDASSSIGYQGRVENLIISAWTQPFPIIHSDSILLRMIDRKAFVVEGHQGSTEMMTTMQRQNVVLKELNKDAIENKLFNNTDVIDVAARKKHIHH